MKAVFEVKTIESDWKPPFKKNITDKEYKVSEGEGFDRIKGNGNDENAFIVEKIKGDQVLIHYSRLVTPKEPHQAKLDKDRGLWLHLEESQNLTYLWGEKGVTKTITYKGVSAEEMDAETKQEIADELLSQQNIGNLS